MMLQATGGNILEHTVTNEAVKQRVIYLISDWSARAVGRNFNGLTIPPGGRLHMGA